MTLSLRNNSHYLCNLTFEINAAFHASNCSNDNSTSLRTWPTIGVERAVLLAVLLGLIISCTIAGNILVLLALIVNKRLRSTTTIFIANLAVADLLLGTTVLPFSATLEITNDRWLFGDTFCDIWAAMDVLCCTASILSLCVISVDRYIGVTRPLKHSRILSHRRAFCIVLAVWLLAMLVSVGPLMGWKHRQHYSESCTVTDELGYVIFSVMFSFYLPSTCILLVYYRIYCEALKQSKFLTSGIKKARMRCQKSEPGSPHAFVTLRVHTGGGGGQHCRYQAGSSRHCQTESPNLADMTNASVNQSCHEGKMVRFMREKKAAKTLGIVVGVFIFCWFPFFFILPLGAICSQFCKAPDIIFKIFFWLGYCNSLCNPVIYARWNREFKWAFQRILSCKFKRAQASEQSRRNYSVEYHTAGSKRCRQKNHYCTKEASNNSELFQNILI